MGQYLLTENWGEGIMALVFNNEDAPVNTLGEGAIRELDAAISEIENNSSVRSVVVTSGKKDFIVGADINQIAAFTTADAATAACSEMQKVFQKLADLKVTTVAAISGQCLGGGLELALACDFRVVTENAKLAFPEIQLGLIPGAGGTQRAPRLIGIQAALDLILTGKRLDGKRAAKCGLVDEVVHQNILKTAALRYVTKKARVKEGPKFGDLQKLATEANPLGRRVVQKKAKEMVAKNTKGFYPAPHKALKVIFQGFERSLAKGLELEAIAFGELTITKEAKSLIHLFHATTHTKKNPEKASTKEHYGDKAVSSLGIIGAGFMGAGIATVAADRGIKVRLSDPSAESNQKALKHAFAFYSKKAKKRRIKDFEVDQRMAHISPGLAPIGFGKTDMVIEAVFEDLQLKRKLLAEVEEMEGETIFATNTSALPIGDIAKEAKNPDRVLGMHFFSPVEKMPLLEIIKTPTTAPWAVGRAFEIGGALGKQIIVVNDGPGFYTTRALAFFLSEAALILEEGVSIENIDKALTRFGFPVGPITLMDEVGIDVGGHVLKTMEEAFPERFAAPKNLHQLEDSGRLGRKNNKGFYKYQNGKKLDPDPEIYRLLGIAEHAEMKEHEIVDRCLLLFINESIRCLDEEILSNPYDADVGAVFGLGFPPFWGGPCKYVDHLSPKVIVEQLQSLAEKYGKRFEPAAGLEKLANEGQKFFPAE